MKSRFTAQDVHNAMDRYAVGERQDGYGKTRTRWLMRANDPKRYGTKQIWGLMHGPKPKGQKSYTTDEMEPYFAKLGRFKIIRPDDETQPYVSPDALSHTSAGNEGATRQVTRNIYERNAKLRKKCVQHYIKKDGQLRCQVCHMSFDRTYGSDIGCGFIHIHHLDPLGNATDRNTHPVHDLIPLCPNCHAMIHKMDRPDDIDGLKTRLAKHSP